MKKRIRFSLRHILLLFTVIAAVLGVIIVPKYRRYTDLEFLMNHPAIKCNSSTFNREPGYYAYLGIKILYEEIDDLEIHLAQLAKDSDLDQLLAAIDRNACIRTLWIHSDGELRKVDLSKYFQRHEFEKLGFVKCSLNQSELPEQMLQAKSLIFYFCLLNLNDKPFRCQGKLEFLSCDVASDKQDVTISAAEMGISFDKINCVYLTLELRGRKKSLIMLTTKSDSLKTLKIVGTIEELEFEGCDDDGDRARISLDISGLSFRHAVVNHVQTFLFKKVSGQELYASGVETEVELK